LTIEARLVTRINKEKYPSMLNPMTNPFHYSVTYIADFYPHHWEIELYLRNIQQYMLHNLLTLLRKNLEMLEHELWGVLLSYNLIRFQTAKMAHNLEGVIPYQLSFNPASAYIIEELTLLPFISPDPP